MTKLCSRPGCLKICRIIKKYMRRNVGPTEEHRRIWTKFERILHWRARFAELTLFVQGMAWLVFGLYPHTETFGYIEEGGQCNEELVLSALPYLKWTLISLDLSRGLLVAISLFDSRICRYFLLHQLVFLMVK